MCYERIIAQDASGFQTAHLRFNEDLEFVRDSSLNELKNVNLAWNINRGRGVDSINPLFLFECAEYLFYFNGVHDRLLNQWNFVRILRLSFYRHAVNFGSDTITLFLTNNDR